MTNIAPGTAALRATTQSAAQQSDSESRVPRRPPAEALPPPPLDPLEFLRAVGPLTDEATVTLKAPLHAGARTLRVPAGGKTLAPKLGVAQNARIEVGLYTKHRDDGNKYVEGKAQLKGMVTLRNPVEVVFGPGWLRRVVDALLRLFVRIQCDSFVLKESGAIDVHAKVRILGIYTHELQSKILTINNDAEAIAGGHLWLDDGEPQNAVKPAGVLATLHDLGELLGEAELDIKAGRDKRKDDAQRSVDLALPLSSVGVDPTELSLRIGAKATLSDGKIRLALRDDETNSGVHCATLDARLRGTLCIEPDNWDAPDAPPGDLPFRYRGENLVAEVALKPGARLHVAPSPDVDVNGIIGGTAGTSSARVAFGFTADQNGWDVEGDAGLALVGALAKGWGTVVGGVLYNEGSESDLWSSDADVRFHAWSNAATGYRTVSEAFGVVGVDINTSEAKLGWRKAFAALASGVTQLFDKAAVAVEPPGDVEPVNIAELTPSELLHALVESNEGKIKTKLLLDANCTRADASGYGPPHTLRVAGCPVSVQVAPDSAVDVKVKCIRVGPTQRRLVGTVLFTKPIRLSNISALLQALDVWDFKVLFLSGDAFRLRGIAFDPNGDVRLLGSADVWPTRGWYKPDLDMVVAKSFDPFAPAEKPLLSPADLDALLDDLSTVILPSELKVKGTVSLAQSGLLHTELADIALQQGGSMRYKLLGNVSFEPGHVKVTGGFTLDATALRVDSPYVCIDLQRLYRPLPDPKASRLKLQVSTLAHIRQLDADIALAPTGEPEDTRIVGHLAVVPQRELGTVDVGFTHYVHAATTDGMLICKLDALFAGGARRVPGLLPGGSRLAGRAVEHLGNANVRVVARVPFNLKPDSQAVEAHANVEIGLPGRILSWKIDAGEEKSVDRRRARCNSAAR